MHVIIFVQSLYAMKNLGKILTLLFDTFHSTKYFHVHNHAIACHFCVDYFTYPNAMKILW